MSHRSKVEEVLRDLSAEWGALAIVHNALNRSPYREALDRDIISEYVEIINRAADIQFTWMKPYVRDPRLDYWKKELEKQRLLCRLGGEIVVGQKLHTAMCENAARASIVRIDRSLAKGRDRYARRRALRKRKFIRESSNGRTTAFESVNESSILSSRAKP